MEDKLEQNCITIESRVSSSQYEIPNNILEKISICFHEPFSFDILCFFLSVFKQYKIPISLSNKTFEYILSIYCEFCHEIMNHQNGMSETGNEDEKYNFFDNNMLFFLNRIEDFLLIIVQYNDFNPNLIQPNIFSSLIDLGIHFDFVVEIFFFCVLKSIKMEGNLSHSLSTIIFSNITNFEGSLFFSCLITALSFIQNISVANKSRLLSIAIHLYNSCDKNKSSLETFAAYNIPIKVTNDEPLGVILKIMLMNDSINPSFFDNILSLICGSFYSLPAILILRKFWGVWNNEQKQTFFSTVRPFICNMTFTCKRLLLPLLASITSSPDKELLIQIASILGSVDEDETFLVLECFVRLASFGDGLKEALNIAKDTLDEMIEVEPYSQLVGKLYQLNDQIQE